MKLGVAVGVAAALAWVPMAVGAAGVAVPKPKPVRLADAAIVEASGLVASGPEFLTTNDSGDEGRVFVADARTGATLGVTYWDKNPTDVEALAPAGPGQVWVGDIGDNPRERKTIEVTKVPWGRQDQTVDEETIDLTYPDGPHDAEALLAHPKTGELFIVTKVLFGGAIYAAPKRLSDDGKNTLLRIGKAPGLVTDGAFFPDGRHFVLRDYQSAYVYTFPGLQKLGDFPLPAQEQGEAIAVAPNGHLWVTTEGEKPLVLPVKMPRALRQAIAGQATAGQATAGQAMAGKSSAPSVGADGSRASAASSDTASLAAASSDTASAWPWTVGGLAGLAGVALIAAAAVRATHRSRRARRTS